MQRLGWDVIAARARDFAAEWATATYEKGDTQTFYNEFFAIFGVKRRTVASYEKRVQTLDKSRAGFIDLFWPGQLLVEQKSAGLDLKKARGQALDYVDWLDDRDQPRYVLTCDFQRWHLLDLETGADTHFTLPELHQHIEAFAFILGRQRSFTTQASVNIKAAELMGRLHDALEDRGYTGHDLERLLVRLLFCLFADDTGIFEPKDIFLQLIDFDTKADGTDTGRALIELFDILDTPVRTPHGRPVGGMERLPLRQRRAVLGPRPHAGFRCRDARDASRCRALQLVEGLPGHFRLAVPAGDERPRTPCQGRALHQRVEHHEGHRAAVPR
ncbi:type IIL restriction-modification enzyme MmeI [Sandarakinorhabdus glacialis]|uniref:type IIL restriction-modification enzyme MmeI n=1 Tax=Sandarakinorhabdus glacialis TaxID=1614636 RepID=UPI001A9C2A44